MISVYRADASGFRKDFVASFNTIQEAANFVDTHPQDFTNSIPLIK